MIGRANRAIIVPGLLGAGSRKRPLESQRDIRREDLVLQAGDLLLLGEQTLTVKRNGKVVYRIPACPWIGALLGCPWVDPISVLPESVPTWTWNIRSDRGLSVSYVEALHVPESLSVPGLWLGIRY